ncbi:unnamed protein product [Umbelopsis ramanniana]
MYAKKKDGSRKRWANLRISTLYRLLGTLKSLYAFYASDGSIIRNTQTAIWNKAAMFGAIFDMKTLQKLCTARKLILSHTMQVNPDLLQVFVQGYKQKDVHFREHALRSRQANASPQDQSLKT